MVNIPVVNTRIWFGDMKGEKWSHGEWPEKVEFFERKDDIPYPPLPVGTDYRLSSQYVASLDAKVCGLEYDGEDRIVIMELSMASEDFDPAYFADPNNGWMAKS